MDRDLVIAHKQNFSPRHGWLGLGLVAVFWPLNWLLPGLRTHWGFFPLWLGYCLVVDGLVYLRRGTSLLTRSPLRYAGLFALSAPVWWLFEGLNERLLNWSYQGAEAFTPLQFWAFSTMSFTTVIPAVFGAAELFASFGFVQRLGRGPVIRPDRPTSLGFFIAGLLMFAAMWIWPRLFFPFVWISIYFITEPLNIWLGNRHLAQWTARGDWRPVVALWLGVMCTAFFWEMWNYFSYPKWVYHIPWGQFWHIFEMPLLGYGGYLPFALEIYALYHLAAGLLGEKRMHYVDLEMEPSQTRAPGKASG
jgi:hypothetical protein